MALQPIPLAGESYQLTSTPAAQHRLMNLYPEALPDGGRAKYYLKSTSGLVQTATAGAGPILSMASVGGSLFVISGTEAHLLADAGPPFQFNLGSVGALAGTHEHASIAVGLVGPVFCVPPRAYVGDFAGSAVSQITAGGGNWPAAGVSSVCYLDGYYVFTARDGSYFFTSDLLSPTVFSGVSFARMSSEVDFFGHCTAFNHELWLWGGRTVSVWYNTGDPTTPFSPRTGAVIHKGCGAYRSIVELDGSLWWLATDGCVYRTVGYQAKRVSTHAIEELLADYADSNFQTVSACGFTHEGHGFYALQLPSIGRTFVYDVTTGLWHERSSTNGGTGIWTINAACQRQGVTFFGDSVDGKLWLMERGTLTEKGVSVQRLAQLPGLVTHGPRAFMSRLEIEMQVGIAGASSMLLSWSDDGGVNYSTPRSLSTGSAGQTRTRVATTRLGSFRQRVLRLQAAGPVSVYAVDVDMGAGDS